MSHFCMVVSESGTFPRGDNREGALASTANTSGPHKRLNTLLMMTFVSAAKAAKVVSHAYIRPFPPFRELARFQDPIKLKDTCLIKWREQRLADTWWF